VTTDATKNLRPDWEIVCDCGESFDLSNLTPPANQAGCPYCGLIWEKDDGGVWRHGGRYFEKRIVQSVASLVEFKESHSAYLAERDEAFLEQRKRRNARKRWKKKVPDASECDKRVRALEARRRSIVATIEELSDLHEAIGDEIAIVRERYVRRRAQYEAAQRGARKNHVFEALEKEGDLCPGVFERGGELWVRYRVNKLHFEDPLSPWNGDAPPSNPLVLDRTRAIRILHYIKERAMSAKRRADKRKAPLSVIDPMSVRQIAQRWGVTVRTVRNQIALGNMRPEQNTGELRFSLAEVERFEGTYSK